MYNYVKKDSFKKKNYVKKDVETFSLKD